MRDANGGQVRLSAGGVSPYDGHFCNAVLWIETTGEYFGNIAGQYGYPPRSCPKLGQYQQRLSNGGGDYSWYQYSVGLWQVISTIHPGEPSVQWNAPAIGNSKGVYQWLSNGGEGQHQYQPFGRAAVALIVVRQLFIPDGSVGDGYGWDPTNKSDGPRWLSF